MVPGLLAVYSFYAFFLSLFERFEACFVLRRRKTAKLLKRIPRGRKVLRAAKLIVAGNVSSSMTKRA